MGTITVLHVIDSLERFGGAERRLLNDLRRLRSYPIRSMVVSLNGADSASRTELRRMGIPPMVLHGENWPMRFSALCAIIRKTKPDLIHTQLFTADILGRTAARWCRVPVVSTIQNSAHEPGTFYVSSWRRLFDFVTIRWCAAIIAVSAFVRTSLRRRLAIDTRRITVIPNYVEFSSPRAPRHASRSGRITLCVVGKINPAKGQRELIDALATLIRKGYALHLLIAGEGPSRRACAEAVAALGIRASVTFLGTVDAPRVLRQADAFVFPSHSEGLPLALLEAVLAKKPCIISSIAPNLEVIASQNCITFTPRDARVIAVAIERFLLLREHHPATLRTMVERAYVAARQKFDPAAQARTLATLYVSLSRRHLAGGRR